ncbi:MAG TPA: IclR family transcriptional regulator [Deltaproteobacteria bacterium]|nr:IclR family transcriptional regulator [Deltaproteobacteria bacterium]
MYDAPVLKRALNILQLIVNEQRHFGISEIAQRLDIHKSTAFGILRALEEQGFIVKDSASKKYSMGEQLVELSKMVLGRTNIAVVAKPSLEELAESVEETVFMGVKQEDRLRIVQVVEAKKDLKISSPIGACLPITAGAPGKAWLAAMKDQEIDELLNTKHLRFHFTDNSPDSTDQFMKEIDTARRMGYAIDLEEFIKGIRAVAALIYSGGQPVAAIWVAGFTSSVTDQKLPRIAHHLLSAAQSIGSRVESQMGSKNCHNANGIGIGKPIPATKTPV